MYSFWFWPCTLNISKDLFWGTHHVVLSSFTWSYIFLIQKEKRSREGIHYSFNNCCISKQKINNNAFIRKEETIIYCKCIFLLVTKLWKVTATVQENYAFYYLNGVHFYYLLFLKHLTDEITWSLEYLVSTQVFMIFFKVISVQSI